MDRGSIIIAGFLGCLLIGCSYSHSQHSFQFHGSTQESFGRDFFYVQYSVTGAATSTYQMRNGAAQGGHVRDGLIADAKKAMVQAHPLGANQAYVNLSIDLTTTESGTAFGETRNWKKMDLVATVSADVIQFGIPPADYRLPSDGAVKKISSSQRTLQRNESGLTGNCREQGFIVGDKVSLSIGQLGRVEGEIAEMIATPNGCISDVKYLADGEWQKITVPLDALLKVNEGIPDNESFGNVTSSCFVLYKNNWVEGVLDKSGVTDGGDVWYRVGFMVEGKSKTRLFGSEEYSFFKPQ